MNWLDFLLGLLLIGVAVLQMFRGFGRAIFDALGLYASLWLADALSLPLAHRVHLHPNGAVSQSYAYGLLFALFGLLSLALSRFVYGMTLIHTGMFEGLLGLASGVGAGMVAGHALVHAIVLADPTGQAGTLLVSSSVLGNELLNFSTYHSVLDTITGATSYRRELPDPSK